MMKMIFAKEEVRIMLKKKGLEVRKVGNTNPKKPLVLLTEALNEEILRRSTEIVSRWENIRQIAEQE